MLGTARLEAIVPVSDLERAISFYEEKLGLKLIGRVDIPGNEGARFEVGGAILEMYVSVGAGQSRHTIAGFEVDDLDGTVEALRTNGVVFEEYDLPNIKTEKGIATAGEVRGAWFKDPDGNILGIGERVRVRATA
jgi:catechol 2,3-dioxygenase-like lactoylglutathione lyase family enzyme